jgi:hypothetical protein
MDVKLDRKLYFHFLPLGDIRFHLILRVAWNRG